MSQAFDNFKTYHRLQNTKLSQQAAIDASGVSSCVTLSYMLSRVRSEDGGLRIAYTISDSTDVRSLKIDWGDGTIDSSHTHTYAADSSVVSGTNIQVKIYGLKLIPNEFIDAQSLPNHVDPRLLAISVSGKLQAIGESAFVPAVALESIDLSKAKVPTINSQAFFNTKYWTPDLFPGGFLPPIKRIILPASIKTLNDPRFGAVDSLEFLGDACELTGELAVSDAVEQSGVATLKEIKVPERYFKNYWLLARQENLNDGSANPWYPYRNMLRCSENPAITSAGDLSCDGAVIENDPFKGFPSQVEMESRFASITFIAFELTEPSQVNIRVINDDAIKCYWNFNSLYGREPVAETSSSGSPLSCNFLPGRYVIGIDKGASEISLPTFEFTVGSTENSNHISSKYLKAISFGSSFTDISTLWPIWINSTEASSLLDMVDFSRATISSDTLNYEGYYFESAAHIYVKNIISGTGTKFPGLIKQCADLSKTGFPSDPVLDPGSFAQLLGRAKLYYSRKDFTSHQPAGNLTFGPNSSLANFDVTVPAHFLERGADIPSIAIYRQAADKALVIEEKAFAGCSSPKVIVSNREYSAGMDLISLGTSCFERSGVEHVEITGASIGNNAFKGCRKLKTAILTDVSEVGMGAFQDCPNLHTVIIKNKNPAGSCTAINNSAFAECAALTTVVLPSTVTRIGFSAFKNCSSLMNIVLPKSTSTIADNAFFGCSSLTSIVIPSSVTSIGNEAFGECRSLKEVTISSTQLRSLDWTFDNCSQLETLTLTTIIPPAIPGAGAFHGCDKLEKIIVPKSALNSYKVNANWQSRSNQICYMISSNDLKTIFTYSSDGTLKIDTSKL